MHSIIREDIAHIISAPLPWDILRGKTVLISGANGFLPAYMVETLLGLNDRLDMNIHVIGIVRSEERARQRFAHHAGRNDFKLHVADVTRLVFRSDTPVHFVVHAASQASPKYYGIDPVGTLTANTTGTQNMLEVARQSQSERFLYFSSSEVYGQLEARQIPTNEMQLGCLDSMALRSCYAEGKRLGETMCVAWSHQYGLSTVIVRPFHTYGPGMALDDGRIFADLVSDIVNGKNIVLSSSGAATRSFCYLRDAIIGFFTVMLHGKTTEAYNVGNPECEISIRGLAEKLVTLFPEKKLSVVLDIPPQNGYIPSAVQRSVPDITKIKSLGWQPTTTVEEGFTRTIKSYT
ncbi:MAG TPA: NAD-dependent epimerase/dehydratase family protein [bacterium]|nr:NAD-dependent epimerase/dehydratase family protein [bacterium]HNC49470.1 NAD-dependent epimerase/dehydratase family protein [bacterium]